MRGTFLKNQCCSIGKCAVSIQRRKQHFKQAKARLCTRKALPIDSPKILLCAPFPFQDAFVLTSLS